MTKVERSVSKQGHLQPRCHSKARSPRKEMLSGLLWDSERLRDSLHCIAKISVTSPIVINMPTRELLASETKNSFV